MSDPYAPLGIKPSSLVIGDEIDPKNWLPFSPEQQRILRGIFAGRVIPLNYSKVKDGQYIPSWIELFPTIEEGQLALGRQIYEGTLKLTVDHVNIRLAGVRTRLDVKSHVSYVVFGKAEALLRQMPARFTWEDLMAAREGSTSEIRLMSRKSIASTLYVHIVAGNIEYIPNPVNPTNASFRKVSPYFDPPVL